MTFDLLITGAQVYSGDSPPAPVDVAVADGVIAAVGRDDRWEAREVIEGRGLILCPGFIDLPAHSGLRPLVDERIVARDFPDGFDAVAAGETHGEHMLGASTDHLLELTSADRDRIFNLGYFTWVEQQGVPLDEFESRRRPETWTEIRAIAPVWDRMIEEFNARTGTLETV